MYRAHRKAHPVTAVDAWNALSEALDDNAPACRGDVRFTAERLTDREREDCESICGRCIVLDLCDAYALTARVEAGYWGGYLYSPKGRK